MPEPTAPVPRSICLLRLSALGDVTHVVPLVRTLQSDAGLTDVTKLYAISQVAQKYGCIFLNTNSSSPTESGKDCHRVKFVWDGNGTNFAKATVKSAGTVHLTLPVASVAIQASARVSFASASSIRAATELGA